MWSGVCGRSLDAAGRRGLEDRPDDPGHLAGLLSLTPGASPGITVPTPWGFALRRRTPDAPPDLVEVVQEVRRILIDAIRAGALELFLTIATRQESHAERAGAARREQVPHTVPDHHRLVDRYTQALGAREEQVGVGLGVLHLVAGHDRHAGGDAEHVEVGLGTFHPPTGTDRPRDARLRQVGEQLARARKGPHLRHLAGVRFRMHDADLCGLLRLP